MALPVDHPVLAVIAPPRLPRFRELLDLQPNEPITGDFTGWSKLVLLTDHHAVLFPRDHTQVDALDREVAALTMVGELGISVVPTVHAVHDDRALSAHRVVVLERMPGVPLSGLIEDAPVAVVGDLFGHLGALAARWHEVDPDRVPMLPRRRPLDGLTPMGIELELSDAQTRAAAWALERARTLEPVLVHGDLHEGQLLVDPGPPHTLRAIIDWQTARIDHPFAEFDLGEWGTALWRGHRLQFPDLRRRAWDTYARARGLPDDLAPVFEWYHACAHARRLLGMSTFPVQHGPGVVGTLDEARQRVISTLDVIDAD